MIISNLKEQLDKSINETLINQSHKSLEEEVDKAVNKVSKDIVLNYIADKVKYSLNVNISTQLLITQWESEINLDSLPTEKLEFFHKNVPQQLQLELTGVFLKEGFVGTYEYNSQSIHKFMNYILNLLEDTMTQEEVINCQTQIIKMIGVKYVILDLKEIEQIHPIDFTLKDESGNVVATNIDEFKKVIGL